MLHTPLRKKFNYYIIRVGFYQNGQLHKYPEDKEVKEIDGILTPFLAVMSLPDCQNRTELQVSD